MNTEQFQNQVGPAAILTAPITAIATSCIVSNPANFSVLQANQQFRMAIQDTPSSPIEEVIVTATAGATFTITRGAGAISHVAGASCGQVVTADQFAAMYPNGVVETGASPYVFDGSLPVMEINAASPAASAVSIHTALLVPFRVYTIADGGGVAGTDHITITPDSGLIGGAANYVISTNNGSIQFYWNGTGCRLV
jgi:hypothetical protein